MAGLPLVFCGIVSGVLLLPFQGNRFVETQTAGIELCETLSPHCTGWAALYRPGHAGKSKCGGIFFHQLQGHLSEDEYQHESHL